MIEPEIISLDDLELEEAPEVDLRALEGLDTFTGAEVSE